MPCIIADNLTPEQVQAYRIADNKTGEIAEWDYELLPMELKDLQNADFDLSVLGFDPDELDKLLNGGTEETITEGETEPDAVPEVPEEPISKHGEIGQAEARTQLKRFLVSLGYDPQQGGLSNLASTGRLNLILEQNARMAYAVGRWQEGMDPDIKERFPCWRYVGTTSMTPRDSHARYVGHVYSKDDPIWHTIFPPSDFNCKCSVEDCDAPAEPAPKEVHPAESGFSFDPAHAFEEFDYDAIKDPGLRAKAKDGVEKILAEKHPDYGNIDFRNNRKPTEELNAGLDAVGSVWKKPELKNIPVEFMKKDHTELAGETNVSGSGRVESVMVYSNSKHPALTFVHETGHVIDYEFLQSSEKQKARQKVLDLLKSTDGYKALKVEKDNLINLGKLSKRKRNTLARIQYELSDDEVFARAFSQYVAEKNQGLLLDEFRNDAKLRPELYFNSDDENQKRQLQSCFEELLKGIF